MDGYYVVASIDSNIGSKKIVIRSCYLDINGLRKIITLFWEFCVKARNGEWHNYMILRGMKPSRS